MAREYEGALKLPQWVRAEPGHRMVLLCDFVTGHVTRRQLPQHSYGPAKVPFAVRDLGLPS